MLNDRPKELFHDVQEGSIGQLYPWLLGANEMMSHLAPLTRAWAEKLNTWNKFMEAQFGKKWEKVVDEWAVENPEPSTNTPHHRRKGTHGQKGKRKA